MAAIAEIMQWKKETMKLLNKLMQTKQDNEMRQFERRNSQDYDIGVYFVLPENMPHSSIVYETIDHNSIDKAFLLYKKYIEAEIAPFEVYVFFVLL